MSSMENLILNSSTYKIMTCEDEKLLDNVIDLTDDNVFLSLKKLCVILNGKKKGKLNETALKICSDKRFFTSLLNSNPDMDRLKTLIKIEYDNLDHKTDTRKLILNDYATHHEMIVYLSTLEFVLSKTNKMQHDMQEELMKLINEEERLKGIINSNGIIETFQSTPAIAHPIPINQINVTPLPPSVPSDITSYFR